MSLLNNSKKYFILYNRNIFNLLNDIDIKKINTLVSKIVNLKKESKIILAGNGGSASIASHTAVDFTKILKVRAINFNEANLITCFSNDYGYEKWVAKAFEAYASKNDIAIFISSSGESKNILRACKYAKKKGIYTVTLTGFKKKNKLSLLGNLNFWVNSKKYNHVENVHQILLLSTLDYISEKNIKKNI
jgi:D-sedoheptulose 7-phosphate isomerase